VIARADEELPGRPLLVPLMRDGRVLESARRDLGDIRAASGAAVAALPERMRSLDAGADDYPVEISGRLEEDRRRPYLEPGDG